MRVENLEQDKIAQALEITKLKKMVRRMHPNKGQIAEIDVDEDVTLEEVVAEVNATKDDEVLSMHDDEPEPAKLKEVIEVLTTAKLMTEVVTAASTITAAPSAARRRKGVVIRDHEETVTPSIIVHSKPKSKDKGKCILVEEPKPFKKPAYIKQDEVYARELEAELNKNINWDDVIEHMDFFRGMSYDDIRVIFEKYFNSNVAFLEKSEKELEEKASMALKQKVKFLKRKQPRSKSLMRREDLEMLWQIVQENFASSKPKNFSDDFLLNTLKAMFEKPDVEAHIWNNQRGIHGLVKVKSWKLLESCGVHIITFTTTHMILLVETRYPLARFTLDQMLNNVRLEVEEESEVSLELLRFVRRQQQEGYRPE
nr:hypothetical protein [Tanacetum cinerariifolium]